MDFLNFYEEVDFDIGKRTVSYFKAKQGDTMSRGFFVRVIQDDQVLDIATTTMKAQLVLPDRNKLEVLAKKVSGKFRVDIPAEALELAGSVGGELELYGSGGELITDDRFTIHVSESIRMDNSNTGGVRPTEFKLLETRVNEIEQAKADKTYVDDKIANVKVDLTPIENQLDKKVDKEIGKGLSTNDYSDADKQEVMNVKDKVAAVDTGIPSFYESKEIKSYHNLEKESSGVTLVEVGDVLHEVVVMKITGDNVFGLEDYLNVGKYIDMENGYYASPIYLKPNTVYSVVVFVKDSTIPATMENPVFVNTFPHTWQSPSTGVNLKTVTTKTTLELTTGVNGLLYINGLYLKQTDLDKLGEAFDIMIVEKGGQVTEFTEYKGETLVKKPPFKTDILPGFNHLFINYPRDVSNIRTPSNVNGTVRYKRTNYEKVAEQLKPFNQVVSPKETSTIKPLYVDSISSIMRYGHYTPDVMMLDERTKEDGTLGNTVFTIDGYKGSDYVVVKNGNIKLSDIEGEEYIAGVIGYNNGDYESCSIKSVDTTNNRLFVYPRLKENVVNGEIGNLAVDGLHLSRRGYRAFAQNVFNTNPKYAEKGTYTDRFSPSLYLGDTGVITSIPNSGRLADYETELNGFEKGNLTYSRKVYIAHNAWDDLLTQKSGKEITLQTKGRNGYCEIIVGGNHPDAPVFKIEKDEGFEMYVEFYEDDILKETYVKKDNLIESLRFDFNQSESVKVVFYYNKVRKNTDYIIISDITCWVNGYDYGDELLPKYQTVAQMFDSWGVFHNGESAVEMERLINERDGIKVRYTNHSLGGKTSEWGVENFYNNIEKHHPKTMLIDFGINDSNLGLTPTEYRKNMLKICDMAVANDIQPIICFPSFGNPYLGDYQLLVTHQTQV